MRAIVLLVLFLGSASALHADTVTATWDPNSESDIAGYLLAYGTVSGQHPNGVPVGNVTTWQLSLAAGQRYYFVIQAYNTGGLYSQPSAEVFIDIPNPAPSIVVSSGTAVSGQTVAATVANGPGFGADWVGLYPASATSAVANLLASQYLNGRGTAPGVSGATLAFTMPAAGTYNVRFFQNDSLTVLATSSSITVVPSIVLSATTAVAGQTVTATIAGGPGYGADWVGLYPASATSAVANLLASLYLNGRGTAPGVSGATLPFRMPAAGTYNIRFFQNDSLTVLATSSSITVTTAVVPSIVLSATTAVTGQTVTATIANGPGFGADWVGLYPASATSAVANLLASQYLNGRGTAPGVSGATLTFTMPTVAGTYNVRFFQNDSLTVLGTSSSITVVAPSIVLSATTARAGQTVTATIAGGPGYGADWVGLYPASATSAVANLLASQYLNGRGTAPGVSGATLTFRMPAAGTYNIRFFENDSLTGLATSATITVTP
jgi:hypothetical protein